MNISAVENPQQLSVNNPAIGDIENQLNIAKNVMNVPEINSSDSSSRSSTQESEGNKSMEQVPEVVAEQPKKKEDTNDEQICKICLEKELEDCSKTVSNQQSSNSNADDKFISPCKCKGSIQYIHSMCFFKLLIMRCKNLDGNDIYKCEQCQQVFYLEETAQGFQTKQKKIVFNILFVIALLFSIGILVTYILILLNVFYSDSNILCIFLVISPFIIVILYWQLSTCIPDTMKSDKWKVSAKSDEKCIEYQIDSKNQMILVSVSSYSEKEQQQTIQQDKVKQIEGNNSVIEQSISLSKSSLTNHLLIKISEDQI